MWKIVLSILWIAPVLAMMEAAGDQAASSALLAVATAGVAAALVFAIGSFLFSQLITQTIHKKYVIC